MTVEMSDILARFIASPTGLEMQRRAEAEQVARRQALIDELVAVRRTCAEAMGPLEAKVREATARLAACLATAAAAEKAVADSVGARRLAALSADIREASIKGALIGGADPKIATFLVLLRRLAEEARRRASASDELEWRGPVTEPSRWELRRTGGRDYTRFNAEIAAIDAARAAAEQLQLEALDTATVEQKLAALRATVPRLEPE
jgi:hypothetical protein